MTRHRTTVPARPPSPDRSPIVLRLLADRIDPGDRDTAEDPVACLPVLRDALLVAVDARDVADLAPATVDDDLDAGVLHGILAGEIDAGAFLRTPARVDGVPPLRSPPDTRLAVRRAAALLAALSVAHEIADDLGSSDESWVAEALWDAASRLLGRTSAADANVASDLRGWAERLDVTASNLAHVLQGDDVGGPAALDPGHPRYLLRSACTTSIVTMVEVAAALRGQTPAQAEDGAEAKVARGPADQTRTDVHDASAVALLFSSAMGVECRVERRRHDNCLLVTLPREVTQAEFVTIVEAAQHRLSPEVIERTRGTRSVIVDVVSHAGEHIGEVMLAWSVEGDDASQIGGAK